MKYVRFENVHAVEARSPCWPICRAGRGLNTTLGWSIKQTVKMQGFENVRAVEAKSTFGAGAKQL